MVKIKHEVVKNAEDKKEFRLSLKMDSNLHTQEFTADEWDEIMGALCTIEFYLPKVFENVNLQKTLGHYQRNYDPEIKKFFD